MSATLDGHQLRQSLSRKNRTRRDQLSTAAAVSSPGAEMRNDLLPPLDLITVSPASLKIPNRNVRKIEPAHLREVASAITTFGFCHPPLIDQDLNVLDGVVRVEAAKQLKLDQIPCLRASHLNADERRLLRLALNRLAEKGGWALEELRAEFAELLETGITIESSGFTEAEIDQIIIGDEVDALEQGPLTPEPDAACFVQIGDIFAIDEHRIICGDATDPDVYAKLLEAQHARLIFTDEPYNVPIGGHVTKGDHREFVMASGEMSEAEFAAFNRAWIHQAVNWLCDGGAFGTFIDWRGYPTVHHAATEEGLSALNLVVWSKTNAGLGSLYRSQHELFPLYKKGDAPHVNNVSLGQAGRWRSNVWIYPGASSLGSDSRKGLIHHPTVKPVAMCQDAILDLTHRGEIVLDPFLGSGSTLIAAERARRRCYGIELDPKYVALILNRFQIVFGKVATLADTGEPFELVQKRRSQSAANVTDRQGATLVDTAQWRRALPSKHRSA